MRPVVDPDWLFPARAAFAPCTDLEQTRMLGYTPLMLDTVSSLFVGLLGGRPAVRHEAGAGDEVFALYRRAGLEVDEDTHPYRSAAHAYRIAEGLIADGRRLLSPFPLPAGRFADRAQLVPAKLWRRLNAKQHLSELVPAAHLPRRRLVPVAALDGLAAELPLFLKAGGDAATGWGFAVRPCFHRAALEDARRWFGAHGGGLPVIVEEAVDVERSWCAGIAVSAAGTVAFGGAEQVFSAPARQSGSVIDPEHPFPEEGQALAERVGEAARALGFRGVAGLDIGRAKDGRLLVFDPNFRCNSSTAQLLFHAPAAARAGLPASRSVQLTSDDAFDVMAARLGRAIDGGWFVPLRVWNGVKHPLSAGRHQVTGFVLARDRAATRAAAVRIATLLRTGSDVEAAAADGPARAARANR